MPHIRVEELSDVDETTTPNTHQGSNTPRGQALFDDSHAPHPENALDDTLANAEEEGKDKANEGLDGPSAPIENAYEVMSALPPFHVSEAHAGGIDDKSDDDEDDADTGVSKAVVERDNCALDSSEQRVKQRIEQHEMRVAKMMRKIATQNSAQITQIGDNLNHMATVVSGLVSNVNSLVTCITPSLQQQHHHQQAAAPVAPSAFNITPEHFFGVRVKYPLRALQALARQHNIQRKMCKNKASVINELFTRGINELPPPLS